MNTRKIPLRQCNGCGQMAEKKSMIRIIKTNENEIFLDLTGRKNGRGAYICKSIECFDKAVSNRGFEKSLKTKIPKEIIEQLREELNNES